MLIFILGWIAGLVSALLFGKMVSERTDKKDENQS